MTTVEVPDGVKIPSWLSADPAQRAKATEKARAALAAKRGPSVRNKAFSAAVAHLDGSAPCQFTDEQCGVLIALLVREEVAA